MSFSRRELGWFPPASKPFLLERLLFIFMATSAAQKPTAGSTEASAEAVGSLALRGSQIPLQPTGALDKYKSFDLTPFIGREYPEVQLVDLLRAPDADELLRELAIIVSQRGVAFFRSQEITIEEQKLVSLNHESREKQANTSSLLCLHLHLSCSGSAR